MGEHPGPLASQLWAAVSSRPATVPAEVTGTGGALPSRFAAEEAAVACAGVALRAAAALHEHRGGPKLAVRLDRDQVAAVVRSERYFRWRDRLAGPGFAPLSRFWPAADGWVRTHANYPWHEAALVRALGSAAAGIAAAESADGVTPGVLPCQLLDHGTGYLAAAAALEGLRCQQERGGTQLRSLSLARTAWWLTSAPLPPATSAPAAPPPGPQRWMAELPSGGGPVTAVSPPGWLGGRALRWPGGPACYLADRPQWLPR